MTGYSNSPTLPAPEQHGASQKPIAHIFQLLGNFSRCSVQLFCDLFLSGRIQAYEGLAKITVDYVFDGVIIRSKPKLIAAAYARMVIPVKFQLGSVYISNNLRLPCWQSAHQHKEAGRSTHPEPSFLLSRAPEAPRRCISRCVKKSTSSRETKLCNAPIPPKSVQYTMDSAPAHRSNVRSKHLECLLLSPHLNCPLFLSCSLRSTCSKFTLLSMAFQFAHV